MFDKKSYIDFLHYIKNYGYEFSRYEDITKDNKKQVIIRHDIDNSISYALNMAKIEKRSLMSSCCGGGGSTTYFLMLRSPFYNLFSRANNDAVREIIDLGHNIGLHYDEGYYADNLNLKELVNREINFIESNFQIKVNCVSFHQPSQKIINNEVKIDQINTYDKNFFKDIKYLSDSNMSFREDPFKIISEKKYNKIQILIHPIWWMAKGNSTEEKFIDAIKHNFNLEQRQILTTERAYGDAKSIILKPM